MKIYTKTGDDGTTSLFDGTRVPKDDPRVDAYGDVDELNSVLGVLAASVLEEDIHGLILQIQRDLFALGAQMANPSHKKQKEKADFGTERVERLERAIDAHAEEFGPIRTFMLPGGGLSSAQAEVARSVCRRAERKLIALAKQKDVAEVLIVYLNRLSDLLFMVARVLNKRAGTPDIPWDA